ncbi:hypothetical protein QTL95_11250 [Rhizobium sp. S152]|uniref:hypothetical protein n=1 Tax=Rhizobium sp. S152 TaxID=3055038 RepID=UPI0025A971B0|nr:hypothetical protein [Rhizobium sp. S152]MDM9626476.1 hypothetical protein [Rhizobium sp. S152]
MKIAVIQFDDRPIEVLAHVATLIGRNAQYAKQHGYEYAFVNRLGMDIPPFWAKPHIAKHYLNAGYDAVLWLDTDAVVHDIDMPVDRFFSNDEVFVYSSDNPVWRSPFNAGVFMCRGQRGLELMTEWAALYPPDLWEKTGQQWICRDPRWAGPAYEQGSFVTHMLPKYALSGLLKRLPWEVLQAPFPMKGSFTLHFAGQFKPNIGVYSAPPSEQLAV